MIRTAAFFNQKGSSLVQVIIAVGISAVVGLVLSQTVLHMRKMENLANLSSDAQDWVMGMELLLVNREACSNTLMGASGGNPITMNEVRAGYPIQEVRTENLPGTDPYKVMAEVGKPILEKRLNLREMKLKVDDGTVDFPANSSGRAYLNVIIEKLQENSLGGDSFQRRINLLVNTDADGSVVGCAAIDQAQVKMLGLILCQQLTGQSGTDCDIMTSDKFLAATCSILGMMPNYQTRRCTL